MLKLKAIYEHDVRVSVTVDGRICIESYSDEFGKDVSILLSFRQAKLLFEALPHLLPDAEKQRGIYLSDDEEAI